MMVAYHVHSCNVRFNIIMDYDIHASHTFQAKLSMLIVSIISSMIKAL